MIEQYNKMYIVVPEEMNTDVVFLTGAIAVFKHDYDADVFVKTNSDNLKVVETKLPETLIKS